MNQTHVRVTQEMEGLTVGETYEVYGIARPSLFIFNDNANPIFLHDIIHYEWVK